MDLSDPRRLHFRVLIQAGYESLREACSVRGWELHQLLLDLLLGHRTVSGQVLHVRQPSYPDRGHMSRARVRAERQRVIEKPRRRS